MNVDKLIFLVVISILGLFLILIAYSIPWISGRASRLEYKSELEKLNNNAEGGRSDE
jgi:hypothetical protein